MPQHEECNLFLEDFVGDALYEACRGCFALDGRRCLGVSHKRNDTGEVITPLAAVNLTSTPFINLSYLSHFIFPPHPAVLKLFHLISPSRLLLWNDTISLISFLLFVCCFRKIAQAGGGGQGQGELWCHGVCCCILEYFEQSLLLWCGITNWFIVHVCSGWSSGGSNR